MDLTVRMDTILTLGAAEAGNARTDGSSEFEDMVQTYRPRVFRFLLASLRDRESAENLTQDCFLRAYRARDQFRGESNRTTWLMQIAINLVRKHESSSRLKFWRRRCARG
jgi:RNA polymerase sigma-70 factor (ECF subfamily)